MFSRSIILLIALVPLAWGELDPFPGFLGRSELCSCRPLYEKCSSPSLLEAAKGLECAFPTKPCCTSSLALQKINYSRLNKRETSAARVLGPSLGRPIATFSKTCSCVPSNQCEDGNADFTFGKSCGFGMVRCCVMSRGVQLPHNVVYQETPSTTESNPSPVFVPTSPPVLIQKKDPPSIIPSRPEYMPERASSQSSDPYFRPERQTAQPQQQSGLRPGQVTSLASVPRYPLPGVPVRKHSRPVQPGQVVSLPRNPRPEPTSPLRPGQATSLSRRPNPSFNRRPSPLLKKSQFNPQDNRRRQPPPPSRQRLSPEAIQELRRRDAERRAFLEAQRRQEEQQLQKRRLEHLQKNRPSTKETSTLENLTTIFRRFFG